jgi:hypothetical protein
MYIDAIDQWTRDSVPIARDLLCRATATAPRIAGVATGTRIHCRDQLKPGGKLARVFDAGQAYNAAFKGFAQGLQCVSGKFRKFVEEQDAQMSQREFAGPLAAGTAATADERCDGSRMLGASKRASPAEGGPAPGGRFQTCDLQRLTLAERREQPRQSLSQQGLAGSRRPDHQHAVLSRRGNLKGALRTELATDLGQIR